MSKLDIGRVRGSLWYSGTAMTGTEENVFPNSGIEMAYREDYYLNLDNGNIYRCTSPGAPEKAKWMYAGNFADSYTLEAVSEEVDGSLKYGTALKLHGNEIGRAYNVTEATSEEIDSMLASLEG